MNNVSKEGSQGSEPQAEASAAAPGWVDRNTAPRSTGGSLRNGLRVRIGWKITAIVMIVLTILAMVNISSRARAELSRYPSQKPARKTWPLGTSGLSSP